MVGLVVVLLAALALGMAGTAAADPTAPDCEDVEYEENGDWYEVENLSQLQCIDEHGLEKDYVLVDDIEANETEEWNDDDGFEPIGDGDSSWDVEGDAFNGTFDGNDRTIANLTINRSGDDFVGLFEVIGSEGTVSDLTLESATVEGNINVGTLSGENYGTVSNLTLESATVRGNDDGIETGTHGVGGLIGENEGKISNVFMSVDVTASGDTGGVVGSNFGGTITGTTVEGTVFSEQDAPFSRVGGIVGYHQPSSSIDSSSFTNGTVDGDDEKIGGIAGEADGSPITNSSANGTIGNEDADSVGGLVGFAGNADLSDSYATATVRGNDSVGGVIGDATGSALERTYAVGEVDGDGDAVGGLVGDGLSHFEIEDSYWDTETTGVSKSFDSDEEEPITDDEYGLTTDEMTGANAPQNMDGFGFPDGDDRWHAVEDDYPVLSYEDTDPVYGVEITGTNSAIEEGEILEVDATVINWGPDGGAQSIELRDFDGDEVDTEEVTLDSGEDIELTLEWETEEDEGDLDDVTVASENHMDTRAVSVGAGEVIPQCQTIDTAGTYELIDDIEASDDCIEIEADDVSLDGNDHTISGSGTGIVVNDHSNVAITNVTLSGLDVGIEMTALDNATVEHNTVEGSNQDGLVFEDVQDSTIANNTITEGATSGLHLADATYTAIEDNTLRENHEHGMHVVDSEELVISGNEVVDNGDDEKEPSDEVEDAGIYLSGTSDSHLEANNLTANAQAALFLEESSTDNDMLGNVVNVSVIDGSENWRGIKIDDSPGNTISDSVISTGEVDSHSDRPEYFIYVDSAETVVKDNEIDGHARAGIDIRGESNTVDNNSIAGSFFRSDAQNGHAIRVDATGEDWSVTNNSLNGAEILDPERAGIAIIGDQTVEIQNNTGTKLDSDLSTNPGADLKLTNEEQFVENQQLTTPAGETTVTFTGDELRLDGVDESPADHDTLESTGYYFEVENSSNDFTFENLELDYNETLLTTGETVDPETLSLWRLDSGEWEEIDDSDVDTDEQVVTGNLTEEGTIGVFGEKPALVDFEVDDVTIEQGEPLEVDLENAENSIGVPFDDEIEIVFETDVFDDPVTKNVTFEDGNASDVELLNASQTADLSAATTTVEVDAEGQDVAREFDLTVEVVLAEFNVADDVALEQGEPLEVDLENAEDRAGDTFTGTVDLTGDDIDGQALSADGVEFDDSGAVGGIELLGAQTTWGVSAGEYRDVTIDAVDTDTTTQFDVTLEEVFADGDGRMSNPFVVENWGHLDNVRDYPDANVRLANDLDAETDGYGDVASQTANGGDGFEPIGNDTEAFEGSFDGNGATISDLYINRSGESDVGLFGVTGDSATIEDVHLENATVRGESAVGSLVGASGGDIDGSFATGTVNGTDTVGGLVGDNTGSVQNSAAGSSIEGEESVGGLVGDNGNQISHSFATGTVDGDADVGGLVGANDATVEHSYWDVDATTQSESDGSDDEYGLTTNRMTGLNATHYMDALEFPDGDGTWHVTDSYPALAWEETAPVYDVTVTGTNAPIDEGDTLEVTTAVTNWGADGEQTVELLDFDGDQQATASVALDSGEDTEEVLEWETTTTDAGTDNVTVATESDVASEEVTIESAPASGGTTGSGSGTSSPGSAVESDETASTRVHGDELQTEISPSSSDGVSESHLEFETVRSAELEFAAADATDEYHTTATIDRLEMEFTERTSTAVTIRESSEPTSEQARELGQGLEAASYLQIATDVDADQFESATVEFSISTDALETPDDETNQVSLYHFDPDADEWHQLETTLIAESDDEQRFIAAVDRISQFAIGVGTSDTASGGSGTPKKDDDETGDGDDGSTDAEPEDGTGDGIPGFSVGITLVTIGIVLLAGSGLRSRE